MDDLFGADLLYFLGAATICISMMMRKMVHLRVCYLFSQIFFGSYGLAVSSVSIVVMSCLILSINGYNLWVLIKMRREAVLPTSLREIYEIYQLCMTSSQFKKMIDDAPRKRYSNTTLIKEGEEVVELLLIIEGSAEVIIGEKIIALLQKGDFIGEFGLLTGSPASANVVCESEVEVAFWKREEFENDLLLKRMVSINLAQKIKGGSVPAYHKILDFSSKYKELIDIGMEKSYGDGDLILREGEEVEELLLIVEGNVDLIKEGRKILTLSKGNFLGELGVLTGSTASVTIISSGKTEAVAWKKSQVLAHDELKQMVGTNLAKKLGDVTVSTM